MAFLHLPSDIYMKGSLEEIMRGLFQESRKYKDRGNTNSFLNLMMDLNYFPYHGEENSEKYTFIHAGLVCKLERNPIVNVWLGYVYFRHVLHYTEIDKKLTQGVHGGLTYGDGEKLGFDTMSCGDLVPSQFFYHDSRYIYRDYNYVVSEVKKLAEQLSLI